MTRLQQQKGFTLVELAIVITIIGLLIGGILKGRQLMENARVTATIQGLKGVETAALTFEDTYGFKPGDMPGNGKIPGCGPGCDLSTTFKDGRIGVASWPMVQPEVDTTVAAATGTKQETYFFWYDMGATGLISGINGTAPITGAPAFGPDFPTAKWGGGIVVMESDGAQTGARASGTVTITGTVLAIVMSPTAAFDTPFTSGTYVLTPALAEQIDRKMDDAKSGNGPVQAFGNVGCTGTPGMGGMVASPTSTYTTADPARDCGLYVELGS
jgi:prepilin-type N-terminal cleavage/methylation domain-containing protein